MLRKLVLPHTGRRLRWHLTLAAHQPSRLAVERGGCARS
jgi:hypothetical protein